MINNDQLTITLTVVPFIIGIIAVYVRTETSLAAIKNDICWLKKKALERRASDEHCPNCGA